MSQNIFYSFVQAWLLGLISLVIGRYAGKALTTMPPSFVGKLMIYLQVWGLTFIAQLVFGYCGHQLLLKESLQSGIAEFLLPMAVGSFFARQLLLRASVTRESP